MESVGADNLVEESVTARYLADQEKTLRGSHYVYWREASQCCLGTVESHAEINPIMVCGNCRHIIKIFEEERAYKNFLAFCHSRGRNVKANTVGKYFMVVYKSHGNL